MTLCSSPVTRTITEDLDAYKEILNDLGWRLQNNGKITQKDWSEIVLPKLQEMK